MEPGSFDTDIWTRNALPAAGLLDPASPNAARALGWRHRVEHEIHRAGPQPVADLIARILQNPHPRLRYVIGRDARLGVAMRSVLPWRLFERLIIKTSGMDA